MLDMRIRKNHKQRAAPIFLDPSTSGTGTCPVAWLTRHLDNRRKQGATPEDDVFTAKRGQSISGQNYGVDGDGSGVEDRDAFVAHDRSSVADDGRIFVSRNSDYGRLEIGCVSALFAHVGPRCKTGRNWRGAMNCIKRVVWARNCLKRVGGKNRFANKYNHI